MITIPVAFLFLGASVTKFGTFGMGFIALPSVFTMMPMGNLFGGLWFFVLFLAALTSSITMLQPGILFLEEGFGLSKRISSSFLFLFTMVCCLPIIYFNKDFTALDLTDFYVGTILIYILATIQILIFVWKIGVDVGVQEGDEGSHIKIPNIYKFIMRYITPYFLIFIFIAFLFQKLPEYLDKMDVDSMVSKAILDGTSVEDAAMKAWISRFVILGIISVFIFTYFLVNKALVRLNSKVGIR